MYNTSAKINVFSGEGTDFTSPHGAECSQEYREIQISPLCGLQGLIDLFVRWYIIVHWLFRRQNNGIRHVSIYGSHYPRDKSIVITDCLRGKLCRPCLDLRLHEGVIYFIESGIMYAYHSFCINHSVIFPVSAGRNDMPTISQVFVGCLPEG